jgi:hypothetical protein
VGSEVPLGDKLRRDLGVGGDLASTHMVKGLDMDLLRRVRAGPRAPSLPSYARIPHLRLLFRGVEQVFRPFATRPQLRRDLGVGGDLASTHMVKGLDMDLLRRVRAGEDHILECLDTCLQTRAVLIFVLRIAQFRTILITGGLLWFRRKLTTMALL